MRALKICAVAGCGPSASASRNALSRRHMPLAPQNTTQNGREAMPFATGGHAKVSRWESAFINAEDVWKNFSGGQFRCRGQVRNALRERGPSWQASSRKESGKLRPTLRRWTMVGSWRHASRWSGPLMPRGSLAQKPAWCCKVSLILIYFVAVWTPHLPR